MNGDNDLLSQQSNAHVNYSSDGNGLKIYRLVDSSTDPGAFSEGSSKYELLVNITTQLITDGDQIQNELESYIDLEPATGLGVRSRLRYGVSHSIWECDPETNEHCKLARYSDNNGKCYDSVGGDFTYPCSASNILTPGVIGGKIIPDYWYEDHKQPVDNTEIALWTKLAKEGRSLHGTYSTLLAYGAMIGWIIGFPMLLMLGCFASKREYLNHGAVNANRGAFSSQATSSTVKSVAGSTASATE